MTLLLERLVAVLGLPFAFIRAGGEHQGGPDRQG